MALTVTAPTGALLLSDDESKLFELELGTLLTQSEGIALIPQELEV